MTSTYPTFILPPPVNAPVQTGPSQVQPFVGPIPVTSSLGLLYRQQGGKEIIRIPHKTLRQAAATGTNGLAYFDANPTSCTVCARPFYPHKLGGFTILFQCPHWPDDADSVEANQEIEWIVRDSMEAPLGDVVVLKHQNLPEPAPAVDPTAASVFTVPFVDVSLADVDAIDRYVARAIALLKAHRLGWRYFVQFEAAEQLAGVRGNSFFPMDLAPWS
ncbi:hypothetical protein C8F01DRAFT_1254867 [Mycena amicta]|nr:hypothetical protein C8F01DRAFT_1254867 [Mycena amicta]